MISLTAWIYIIKTLLNSKLTRNRIREIILDKCLYSRKKVYGAYQVDPQKVWSYLIITDKSCYPKMEKLHIDSVYDIISYYEETEYKKMRYTYPRKHHKKG